eukprot:TRINITY_DN3603_c0_g1_i1.p1 TRINITY_DN3603_c0_g1~~TRINITY_DN3603_c0_g1_i1.p1  ORF type:complete len:137 (+),score=14.04 TRINITY_DN3603_c0_g1_i1:103-513(+)
MEPPPTIDGVVADITSAAAVNGFGIADSFGLPITAVMTVSEAHVAMASSFFGRLPPRADGRQPLVRVVTDRRVLHLDSESGVTVLIAENLTAPAPDPATQQQLEASPSDGLEQAQYEYAQQQTQVADARQAQQPAG